MPHPLVVHCRRARYEVYIGRPGNGEPGPFGNPFIIGQGGILTRRQSIAAYRDHLYSTPALLARVRLELPCRILGCFCAPLPCHGDVLAEAANPDMPCTPAIQFRGRFPPTRRRFH